jgi:hypothetical protein
MRTCPATGLISSITVLIRVLLPSPIGPHQGRDFSLRQIKIHIPEDRTLMIGYGEVVDP